MMMIFGGFICLGTVMLGDFMAFRWAGCFRGAGWLIFGGVYVAYMMSFFLLCIFRWSAVWYQYVRVGEF
ncbi:hypothetical protein B0T19DRAFT_430145 [Cercophora scortea]|uniref:Uncharacterized protein n=1 Tax=Cercophora scortea TaxID=314031 RepID=A0AAE0I8P9_9PEZI|nr:hypothetical protein B0T19DRAFT_430145 [Cercophora scortea]